MHMIPKEIIWAEILGIMNESLEKKVEEEVKYAVIEHTYFYTNDHRHEYEEHRVYKKDLSKKQADELVKQLERRDGRQSEKEVLIRDFHQFYGTINVHFYVESYNDEKKLYS